MDALSISTAIGSIISVSVKVGLSIDELNTKLRRAPVTLEVIRSQCELMKATLGQLQGLVMRDGCIRTQGLVATFDQTLSACNIVFKCLELDVRKLLSSANPSKRQSWIRALVARTTVVLNESSMNNYLSMLQGQQVSLGLLIQLVQLQSVDEIHFKIHERQDILDQQSAQAHSLRDSNPEIHAPASILGAIRSDASIFGPNSAFTVNDEIEFSFDNEVVDSRAYRQIIARATQIVRQQGKLLETVVSNDNLTELSSPIQVSKALESEIAPERNVKDYSPGLHPAPILPDYRLEKYRGHAEKQHFDYECFLDPVYTYSHTEQKLTPSVTLGKRPEPFQTDNSLIKQTDMEFTGPTKAVYSKSGFDMLRTLYYVSTRPEPEISLGPIDMATAFVVCDVTMHDCPIIYASDTFLSLIGYSRQEILGKNCRFLQSPDGKVEAGSKREFVDNSSVYAIKQKISQGKEVQQSIINYKKGGKPFLNLLTLIPVPGDTNEIRHYCGFCIDLVETPEAMSTENGRVQVGYTYQY